MKDPLTGKRVSRPNPKEQWIVSDAPHLRIIDDDTWNKVQDIKARFTPSNQPRERRFKHLLSGLLTCSECGGPFWIVRRNTFGCKNHKETMSCANARVLDARQVEAETLSRLIALLNDPFWLEEHLGSVQRQSALNSQRIKNQLKQQERELQDAEDKLTHIIRQIERGIVLESLVARARELEIEIQSLRTNLQVEATTAPVEQSTALKRGLLSLSDVLAVRQNEADKPVSLELRSALKNLVREIKVPRDKSEELELIFREQTQRHMR